MIQSDTIKLYQFVSYLYPKIFFVKFIIKFLEKVEVLRKCACANAHFRHAPIGFLYSFNRFIRKNFNSKIEAKQYVKN